MVDMPQPWQPQDTEPVAADLQSENTNDDAQQNGLRQLWARLHRLGLGDSTLRFATATITLVLVLVVVGVMNAFYLPDVESADVLTGIAAAEALSASDGLVEAPEYAVGGSSAENGVARRADLHTVLPLETHTRAGVVEYTVESGDSIFTIAEKFNLKPETILWGNRFTLRDDPHYIVPGQMLNILPVDGVYHRWSAGEGLNGVASVYGVTPEEIVNWPGNDLNAAEIGDFANPDIPPDTMLVIPGGQGSYMDLYTPRITRDEPATAKNLGAGACTGSFEGITGTLTFLWPTTEHYLSGYDYMPEANHYGIDIAGQLGNPIYTADNGVVVYAGWNDYGYGEMVVIDHGAGWQTLYGHLSQINVGCGQEVYQGDLIGLMGGTGKSTGPHLHFEMRSDDYGRVNPWDFLIP